MSSAEICQDVQGGWRGERLRKLGVFRLSVDAHDRRGGGYKLKQGRI